MPTYLSPDELHNALKVRDLSNPDHRPHAMQLLLRDVVRALRDKGDVTARTIRHSPLVSVADNYDRLGFSPADVTRDQRYSRYISPTVMLRSTPQRPSRRCCVVWILKSLSTSSGPSQAWSTAVIPLTAPTLGHPIKWTCGGSVPARL